ncbi:hypothetical protein PGT21_050265 [Puccinia graminis f. sp. tritici]|uniref:Uncharacterized protein n=1 Tax=Puccinia graminis f. sp. tritici TaxID=56615 RepID=A0A5B0N669_PUCGR|nr:hypothetical protein PGT21_050265 [Puccinia graminis f. sp. tritici]
MYSGFWSVEKNLKCGRYPPTGAKVPSLHWGLLGLSQLDTNAENNQIENLDLFTSLPLANLTSKQKLQVMKRELQQQLLQHATIFEGWSSDVVWLCNCCKPSKNQSSSSKWYNLKW